MLDNPMEGKTHKEIKMLTEDRMRWRDRQIEQG